MPRLTDRSTACLCAFLIGVAAPAAAQWRLVADMNRALYAVGTSGTEFGVALARYDLPACGDVRLQEDLLPVLRGLYLAWTATVDVSLPTARTVYCQLDVRSGALSVRPAPPGLRLIAADAERFRVLARADSSLFVLDAPNGQARVIDLSSSGVALGMGLPAYAPAAGLVYLVFKGNGVAPILPQAEPLTVAVIDLETGSITRLASPPERWLFPVQAVATNASGTTLVVSPADQAHSTSDQFTTASVAHIRTDTGGIERAASYAGVFQPGSDRLMLDDSAGRALLIRDGGTIVFDPTTLAQLGRLDAPRRRLLPSPAPSTTLDLVFRTDYDPETRSLLVIEHESERQGIYPVVTPNRRNHMLTFDTTSFSLLEMTDLAATYGHSVGAPPLFRIAPPSTPIGLAVVVSGRVVGVTWSASPGASHYVVEAGAAPGQSGLAAIVTPTAGLQGAGIPPGTYYLRVRAIGIGGQSPATPDIVVTIP